MKTAILLTISNVFMTFAWYGHLNFKGATLWKVVLISWLIAFLEYCFQVPANRIGSNQGFSDSQLKIMQECITLVVFCIFAMTVRKQEMKWNYFVSFGLVLLAVFFVFHEWNPRPTGTRQPAAFAGGTAPIAQTSRDLSR